MKSDENIKELKGSSLGMEEAYAGDNGKTRKQRYVKEIRGNNAKTDKKGEFLAFLGLNYMEMRTFSTVWLGVVTV